MGKAQFRGMNKRRYDDEEEKRNEEVVEEEPVEEQRDEEVEELEELKLTIPEPGQRVKAKVTRIRKGKLGAFINIERIRDPRIRERLQSQESRDAVQVCFDLDGREWCQTFLMSRSPRSNMYRLIKKYGAIKPGVEVEIVYNATGFPRIALE